MKTLYFQILELDTGLKLKTKIYIFQTIFTVILLSFEFFTYKSYESQYNNDLKEYINEKSNFYKNQLVSSYYEAFHKFDTQKKLFHAIHKEALEILQTDSNRSLDNVVKELKKRFFLKNIDFHIYLIDKNYTIYKTTYKKDLGFNLSVVPEAKEFLDKTYIDKKIHISDFVSTDALTMEYKLYSYSYFKDNNFLELGFIDKDLYNSFRVTIEKFLDSKDATIYNILKTKEGYNYYNLSAHRVENKEEFFQKIKKVLPAEVQKNPIIHSYKIASSIIQYKDKKAIVFVPLFKENMYRKIGFENVVLKVKIDISSKLEALQRYKNIFYISMLVTLFFLFTIYIFINRYFTYPIEKIVESITNKKKLTEKSIIDKNDEFSVIAKEYNKLLSSLNKEVLSNKTLLEENKRFIADTVHQIRTPLTNIMMNSEMIKRSDKENKAQNFIDQINASINMLTNSYEDLSYTITYDTIEYPATKLFLSEILTQRIKFFSTISKVNFKELLTAIEEDIYFEINQIELERLIDNNISNAIKYADTNKPITIILKRVQNSIVLEFKSYSKPIRNPQKLFEKNYRENASKRGLGLGLNMVKLICEKYNIEYELSYRNGENIFSYSFKANF